MKALLVTERFPPQRGGVGVSARRQALGLAPHLERLDVVHLTVDLPPGTVAARDDAGFTVTAVGRARREDESLQLLELVLRGLRRRHGHHVVHAFFAGGTALAALLAADGARTVVSVRGNDADRAPYQGARAAGLLWVLRKADVVLCVSRALQARVALLSGRGDVGYVPNAVDGEAFRPDALNEGLRRELGPGPVLLFTGEMRAKKGMRPLLQAMRELDATLVLAGGVRRDESEGFVPTSNVRVLPYQRDVARLRALYNAADLVVIPSLWDGMPNTALEAMACGRPVLGTTAGALPDLLGDGRGHLLHLDELDSLADRLREVLANPDPSVGERARHWVLAHHRPEQEIAAVLAAYGAPG